MATGAFEMSNDQAIKWLENLAHYFERKAADSQEDIEIQACQANATSARAIAILIVQCNIK